MARPLRPLPLFANKRKKKDMERIETRFVTSNEKADKALEYMLDGVPKYQLGVAKLLVDNGVALNVTIYDARLLPMIMDRGVELERNKVGKFHVYLNGREVDTAWFK